MTIRANRDLGARARLGLGTDREADLGVEPTVESEVDAFATTGSVVTQVAAAVAALKVTSLDGADETTPPGEIYAVTGMSATSVVTAVLFVSTKASVATIEVVDPALFTPGTNTLTSLTEVDRTSDQLIVFWFDV